jgi:prolyl oligopeptidase
MRRVLSGHIAPGGEVSSRAAPQEGRLALPVSGYPHTRTADVADTYHGDLVADPYRWLEDTSAAETTAWIAAQNELTRSVLAAAADVLQLVGRLTELADYPKISTPFERGGRWFSFRNSGLQAQPVLFVADSPAGDGRPLLDPNILSADGTVAVSGTEVSEDGSLLAYATSVAGSDWLTWRVRDTVTGEDLPDVVTWSRYSGAAWRDNSGFYYAAPDPPEAGTEYTAEHGLQRIMFHRLGTAQDADRLVFAAPGEPSWIPDAWVSEDGRFLIVSVHRGTAPQAQLLVADLETATEQLRPLVGDFDTVADVVATIGTTCYLVTDYQAGRQRLVAVDMARPGREYWREIIAESADTLVEARYYGGRFVCHYLSGASSVLRVHARSGEAAGQVALPPHCSIAGISGRPASARMQAVVTSFTESGSLWSHDLDAGRTELVRPAAARFDSGLFRTEQVFVSSADGTQVPVFLTRRHDLAATGDVPVLLYGYGGFNVPVAPAFSVLYAAWLERGGMLAVANLRGGGEFGRAWHDGGRLGAKQNVFDDFCACARWLAASGWSRPGRIAIAGGSNGGLLTGACLTQHPELFGACIAFVGVLDMLRFARFTIGRAWIADYGDPADPAQYRWLRAYSPLHNLVPGTRYPATLLLTGDHDDRVVPAHSFKFAAALQAAQGGDAPVLIRVETQAGHGAGKPTAKLVAETADVLAFLDLAIGPGPAPGTAPGAGAGAGAGTAEPGQPGGSSSTGQPFGMRGLGL